MEILTIFIVILISSDYLDSLVSAYSIDNHRN